MNDVVVLMIIVAIGVISTVIKAAGKKKIETNTSADNTGRQDPWAEIFRETRPCEAPETSAQPDLDRIDIDEEKGAELLKQKRMEEVKKRRSIELKLQDKDKIRQNANASEEKNDTFAERFNAKDAVIYSEILKPKF